MRRTFGFCLLGCCTIVFACSAEPERPSRPDGSTSSSSSASSASSSGSSSSSASSSGAGGSGSGAGGSGMGGAGGAGMGGAGMGGSGTGGSGVGGAGMGGAGTGGAGTGGAGTGGAGMGGAGMGGSGMGGSGMGGAGMGGSGMGGSGMGGSGMGGSGMGGSGMGGSGMGGSGMGGAGGAGPTGSLLAIASPSGVAGHFDPSAGFTSQSLGVQIHESSLMPYAGGALVVLRKNSMLPAENNELFWSTWMPMTGFTMPQTIGVFGFAIDGPSIVPLGFAALVTFLGTDNKHYYTQYNGMSFDAFGQIPAGMAGVQAFGPSKTALAQRPAPGAYAVYAGGDSNLYYVQKSSLGSSFTFSAGFASSPVVNTIVPAAHLDENDDLLVFYVRSSDGLICMVKLVTPMNGVTAEEVLHPLAITSGTPSVAKTAAGDYIVAWHGFNDNGIYFLRGTEGAWGAPQTLVQSNSTTSLPVALPGLASAEAEIVFGMDTHIQIAHIGAGNSVNISQGPDTLMPVSHVSAAVLP